MSSFEEYAGLSEEELLVELGDAGFEAFPRDPLTRGREIYATLRATLKQTICMDGRVRRLCDGEFREAEVFAALADLVASQTHGVPAATLSMLLLRDGLPKLCAETWSE